MSNFASEHSTWLKEYCKRVKKAKAQSNGNKKIIPIIIFLMAGGLDAYLIFAKDGLNDPQLQGPVKGIAIGAGVMLVLSILLIALGKKKDVTIRTTSNLNELLTSVEAVKDFEGKNYAYLDLKNEKALSTSNFDVSGTTYDGGIKAYIFGERGVWRPGDTLHVSMVTLFDDTPLPAGHPVTAQLRNPDGQLVQTLTEKTNASNLYHFPFTTAQDAPSGRWRVDVSLGGQTFSKTLRVEAIKPNKLDIQLHFPGAYVTTYPSDNSRFDLSVAWLYGAPGSDLKVNGDLEITSSSTHFKGWEDYDFQDLVC